MPVANKLYVSCRTLRIKGSGVAGIKNLFFKSNKFTSAFRGSSLGSKEIFVPFGAFFQTHGYACRTPRLPKAMGCSFKRG